MIIRSLLRRPVAVRCLAAPAKSFAAPLARWKHTVPTLADHEQLEQHGIPGLFSSEGFKTAYIDYQKLLVNDLNDVTQGTEHENKDPKSLVIEWARDPEAAHFFNVASMAYNNHFFFSRIASQPNVTSQPSSDFVNAVKRDFGSFDTFRNDFLDHAEAMFGPGFVWLVQANDMPNRPLRILNTYIAGSPLSGAHYRRQAKDLNTENVDSFRELNPVGAFGSAAQKPRESKKALGGVDVVPLLCVNTWEHVWLKDYGIGGKRAFLEAWWDKINWNVVQEGATLTPAGGHRQFHYSGMNSFKTTL
ncbi:manganese and iron superoxide dismutase [Sporormia fimetaria CBS 119925]|uniref:Manganese and iron superoxide dismutase n=1 Tax=Sporormia fimetaria CBS 119925 TaxID=1340428 RepID=A0A6A6V0V2_9PLEO|nr:manganese and iron superoxide dismutase [Sporormia fimetaria CBS 119925]